MYLKICEKKVLTINCHFLCFGARIFSCCCSCENVWCRRGAAFCHLVFLVFLLRNGRRFFLPALFQKTFLQPKNCGVLYLSLFFFYFSISDKFKKYIYYQTTKMSVLISAETVLLLFDQRWSEASVLFSVVCWTFLFFIIYAICLNYLSLFLVLTLVGRPPPSPTAKDWCSFPFSMVYGAFFTFECKQCLPPLFPRSFSRWTLTHFFAKFCFALFVARAFAISKHFLVLNK